jgi:hypothetical protein
MDKFLYPSIDNPARAGVALKMLIHLERNDHLKNGDIDLEAFLIVKVLHRVGTIHFSHFSTQIAPADILIPFSRIEDRLYANHSFPFYLPVAPIAVEDMPVTPVQLYGKIVVIFDGNAVGKHIFTGKRIGVIRLIKGLNAYLHAF